MDAGQMIRQKFAKACAAMETIRKDQVADTGSYTYNYSSLTDVLRVVKEGLEPQNLTLAQPIAIENGNLIVTTMITDIDTGESLTFPGPGCPVKGDPQAQGSAISYNRRYALTSLFALEVDDDDGAMAHRAETTPQGRTEAETEVRRIIKSWTPDERKQFATDFASEFGSNLTDLQESRHGDALKFTKFWGSDDKTEPPTDTEGHE